MTSHANLGFHAAWDFGTNGRAVTNAEATQMLYSMYPSPIRRWIAQRGGLTPRMIFLRGKQLQALYKPCYLDAQASASATSSRSITAFAMAVRRLCLPVICARPMARLAAPELPLLQGPACVQIRHFQPVSRTIAAPGRARAGWPSAIAWGAAGLGALALLGAAGCGSTTGPRYSSR